MRNQAAQRRPTWYIDFRVCVCVFAALMSFADAGVSTYILQFIVHIIQHKSPF